MNSTFYSHWHNIPMSEWRWPNFTPQEIACKEGGSILLVPDALDKLQTLRNRLGVPMHINSAYRSPAHNKAVGGKPDSQHLLGIAFDIALTPILDREALTEAAVAVGFHGIGQYNNFCHIDTRDIPARWDLRNDD